jgi:hypothetical protein
MTDRSDTPTDVWMYPTDAVPLAHRPVSACRQPEWGQYVWELESALRSTLADNERLRRQLQSVDTEPEADDA